MLDAGLTVHEISRAVTAIGERKARSVTAHSGVGFGSKQKNVKQPRSKKQQKHVGVAEGEDASRRVTVAWVQYHTDTLPSKNRIYQCQAIKKALKLAGGGAAAPIDNKQASKGRIDYAKVRDWGSGKPEELQSLQVESFRAGKAGSNKPQSFYTHLTYAVAQATEQGRINEILYNELPVGGRQNLPDFAKWSFSKDCYVQYLLDQQRIHHVLESSIAEALAVNRESPSVAAALDCFSERRGLDRSLEIAADLTNLSDAPSRETSDGQLSGGAASNPTAAADAYSHYLSAVGARGAESGDIRDRNQACLQLIAHAYANQLLLLTRGSSIGKTFADKLGLMEKHAVNTYRSYPFEKFGKDPFEALKRNVNEAGKQLDDEEKKILVDELPLAMAHAVQLWESLAQSS